jgi:hypothetical protein
VISRRVAKILAIVGAILLLVGILSMVYAALPAGTQGTIPLPPGSAGAEYYSYYSFGVLAGGNIQGNFTVLNGTPVSIFVYDSSDYNAYANGQNLTGLYNVTAVSGQLSVDVSGFDTYYVVFQHAPGYESVEQDVAVNLTSTGIDPTFFLGGIVAVGVGVLLVVVGIRRMRVQEPAGVAGAFPGSMSSGASPFPPSGPDTTPTGSGIFRVPPPLPDTTGSPSSPGAAGPGVAGPIAPQGPSQSAQPPMGTLVVTVENHSSADETVQLVVNGAGVATLTVPAGTTQQVSVPVLLASPFGSTVTVDAITSRGQRAQQSVFLGARGTAPVALRVG